MMKSRIAAIKASRANAQMAMISLSLPLERFGG
jgi:hypothetical protein